MDALLVLHGGTDIKARASIKREASVAIYIMATNQVPLVRKDFGRINVLGVMAGKTKKVSLAVPYVAHSTEVRRFHARRGEWSTRTVV